MKNTAGKAADRLLLLLAVLLPYKFATISLLPETCNFFADNLFDFAITSWTANLFGIPAGLALLMACTAADKDGLRFSPVQLCVMLSPLAAALPGCINGTNFELKLLYFAHFFIISVFLTAVTIRLNSGGEDFSRKMFCAMTIALLLVCLSGAYQYFAGFEELREYAKGKELSEAVRARIADNRVYATFTSCNNLAGFLLLTVPAALLMIWRFLRCFEPAKYTLMLFFPWAAVLCAGVLAATKSRAAFLSLAAGGVIALFLLPGKYLKLRWKVLSAVIILSALTLGAYVIHTRGRGFDSMLARADYLRSSAILWEEHRLFGCGWGEFFYRHMGLKRIVSNEAAHDPHNIFATFASQCGTAGVVLIAIFLFYTPLLLLKRLMSGELPPEKKTETAAVLSGLVLFILHSCMDANVMYTALLCYAGTLMLCADSDTCPDGKKTAVSSFMKIPLAAAAAAGVMLSVYLTCGEKALDDLGADGLSERELEERLEYLQKIRPYSAVSHLAAGKCFMYKNNAPAAVAAYSRACELEPGRPDNYRRLAAALEADLRHEEAAQALAEAKRRFPHFKSGKNQ